MTTLINGTSSIFYFYRNEIRIKVRMLLNRIHACIKRSCEEDINICRGLSSKPFYGTVNRFIGSIRRSDKTNIFRSDDERWHIHFQLKTF